jgi:hypothetical protein
VCSAGSRQPPFRAAKQGITRISCSYILRMIKLDRYVPAASGQLAAPAVGGRAGLRVPPAPPTDSTRPLARPPLLRAAPVAQRPTFACYGE